MTTQQTTAEKILHLVLEGDGDAFLGIGDGCGPKWENELKERMGVIIAAEIDAKDARIAELNAENEVMLKREPCQEARFKAAAWDAREAYIRTPGDDDPAYEGWENEEFNLRMHEKNAEIAKLKAERDLCVEMHGKPTPIYDKLKAEGLNPPVSVMLVDGRKLTTEEAAYGLSLLEQGR